MSHLYPSLHEKFKSEGLCPICLIEMAYSPRFTCINNHVICHRCRPYYYSCPQCLQPLSELPPESAAPYDPPPPTHMMPHPPHMPQPYPPSAPQLHDFHEHERRQHLHGWQPPSPPREDQELLDCPYAHLGCTAKFVPLLRDMHVSRCQYKHHSEELQPPACGEPDDDPERVPCRYRAVGCNVRAPHWRVRQHEELCIYKDRSSGPVGSLVEELGEQLHGSCRVVDEDQNRMVECRFRDRGCRVRMPLWRKQTHESKCNYNGQPHYEECPPYDCGGGFQPFVDPEQQTDCRWAEFGCRVRPRIGRKELHEEKCNYRMEECAFKNRGCCELFHPSRRFAHEKSCGYAY
ncbi:uncharacterized protein LOC100678053 [Nasonia vitripennis]|uniref:RING-type domain-containing protein n=1 Tax=Nasonia vitripennis TaxID=7425 RepID=A0A7M7LNW6_NASVI|nr:uncharacterized protein LOC100678053 [Nasonia vitripennis]